MAGKEAAYLGYEKLIFTEEKKTGRGERKIPWIYMGLVFSLGAVFAAFLLIRTDTGGVAPEAKTIPKEPAAAVEIVKEEAVPPTSREEVTLPVDDLFARALRAHQEGRIEEAEGLYGEILRASPKNIKSLNNLGIIYLQKGDYDRARRYFNQALEIQETWAEPHYNLACLTARQGKPREALEHLRQAAALAPESLEWARTDEDLRTVRALREFEKLKETRRK